MKTSELTGALLDYWVAKANEEWRHRSHELQIKRNVFEELIISIGSHEDGWALWNPSVNWQQGGEIIDREAISTSPNFYNDEFERNEVRDWTAVHVRQGAVEDGPTALIAAMRAFVSAKFGDEVPDEVTT